MKIGLITREKSYQRGSHLAWKWLYSVNGVAIGTVLSEAMGWAKRRGLTPKKEWK